MSEVLGNTAKKYASRFLQLKVGHSAVGIYLAKIRIVESPQCWWCGHAKQSVEYLYIKCQRWRRERQKLTSGLHKERISWQGWTKKKGLARLLANERALGPFLEYLKSTEVGEKEGGKEREFEQEQRNDQAGEELLRD